MKLKRLIAFTVVMAVIMSCFCAVSTTVSADEIAPIDCATWDGLLKSSSTKTLLQNQYYSRSENKDADGNYIWPDAIAALGSIVGASNLYCTSGTMTERYLALANDGYKVANNSVGTTGTIRSLS
ncbi:MAG: hypothetical protein UH854_05575 [Clostridia bacterium]|nr:hypothetical protein [Clostridia bacterium]